MMRKVEEQQKNKNTKKCETKKNELLKGLIYKLK